MLSVWDAAIHKAMAHPTKRRIIERLQEESLSFTELLDAVSESNHGRFGYHLRTLKEFIELEPSTKKYRLTHRGKLLAACIQDFRFITSINKELSTYAQQLRLGDHAAGFYDTEAFKRKITFPYIKAGLLKGEAVVYLLPEVKLDSELREIQRYGISADHFRPEAFTVMSAEEWYLRKGKAQAKTIIANWQTLVREKQKATHTRAAFTGLRAASETEVFFDNAKTKELLRYEAALGRQLPHNLCGLCLYDANRLEKDHYFQICICHGHLISKGIVGKMIV